MQNDLISRSALIKEIESLTMHITGLRAGKGVLSEFMNEYKKSVLRIMEEQPTAYDVEKIVEQLEEKSNDIPIQYENNYEQGFANGIDYAIDIVRKGGVDNAAD